MQSEAGLQNHAASSFKYNNFQLQSPQTSPVPKPSKISEQFDTAATQEQTYTTSEILHNF